MKTAETIFNELQAEFGEYGEYVLLQQAYYSNSPGSSEYVASAVTLAEIKEMQEDGEVDEDGLPNAADCGYLSWDVTNSKSEDESDACDWGMWHAYDAHSIFIKSAK